MSLPDSEARASALTEIGRSLLVEAGAGSGKTAILAGRIAFLLASGVMPKHIAAITFTEFSASELLIRVDKFVRGLTCGEKLAAELADAFPQGVSEAQRHNLAVAVTTLDQLTCSTIHGFAQTLIAPYPVEANIDPGADIVDPGEADLAFDEQFDAWLREHLSGETEDDVVAQLVLGDEKRAPTLAHELAAFLRSNREARPADGRWSKTRLIEFIAAVSAFRKQLDATGYRETTTDGYFDSFAKLADALVACGIGYDDPSNAALVGTLALAGQGPCFTGGGTPRVFRVLGPWRNSAGAVGRSQADGERACTQAGQRYEDCHVTYAALMAAAAGELLFRLFDTMGGLLRAWHDYKRSAALLDFDDLLYTARDLLAKHERVRVALADRYRHVLVDEFQDTDPLQIEILWRLCGDAPAGGADDPMARQLRPGALFLVGDPKQAIYRFRGADVNAYLAARETIGPSGLREVTANFRSVEPILDFVNERFVGPLTADRQPGFTPLSATVRATEQDAVAALDVAIEAERLDVEQRRVAEAERVAELCRRLIGGREVRDPDTNVLRSCRAGDIALLAPAGTSLWRYEEALEAAGIPVSTQAGKSLFRRQEIQDLIALTRTLADARDTLALGALLRGPLVGLRETELLDLAETLPGNPKQADRLPQLNLWTDPGLITHPLAHDVMGRLQSIALRARSTTPYLLLADAVEALSVRPQLRQRHRTGADRALANVDLYLEMSRAYEVRGLRAFARDMRANWEEAVRQVEGRPDAAQEAVTLVTIHAAKGLEWPIVIPINTMGPPLNESGIFHDRRNKQFSVNVFGVAPVGHGDLQTWVAAEQASERVRLWYVAATRARDLLVLPRHSPDLKADSWAQMVDLGVGSLPVIEPADLPDRMPRPAPPIENPQTTGIFAAEAQRIAEAEAKIEWHRPSRDEAGTSEVVGDTEIFTAPGAVDDAVASPTPDVAGGATRGTILHKLIEEVLTGETSDDRESLVTRATELLSQFAIEPASDPKLGIAPTELAETVLRTLALPEIVPLRSRLMPESSVYAHKAAEDGETLISGIADAIAVGPEGEIDVVIDWKSDVAMDAAKLSGYRAQVRAYCEATDARRGLLVFMTQGQVTEVGK